MHIDLILKIVLLMYSLYCGDVFKILPTLGQFDVIIADPPDNIGLKYKSYKDKQTEKEYTAFLLNLIHLCKTYSKISWISFNAKWIFKIGYILGTRPDSFEHKLFINTFTFGQNNKYDCGSGYRPLLRIKSSKINIYPDAIKVPSWRQLHGDKRATAGGKVPLDVWNFERITGNCKERRGYHPTQLREAMIKRIIDFSTLPGQSVCDLFSGTGTVLRACKDRDITSIELDQFYCKQIAKEHNLKKIKKGLWSN